MQAIQDIMTPLIPQPGFDPAREVQVLCPMPRGDVGARMLSQVLQQLVNSPSISKAELVRGGMTLREGALLRSLPLHERA